MPNNFRQLRRLELAIQAVQKNQITFSIQKVVLLYNILWSTLQNQLNDIKQYISANYTKCKLTEIEKETLLQWILTINKHGTPFRPTTIQNITDLLLINYNMSKPPLTIEINWVWNFIQYHNIFKTCFLQKYNHQQILCKDLNKIQKWFKFIQSTIKEWGIINENIYNFNETGFAISMIATTKVITQTEKHSCLNLVQFENQKWITVIKIINTSGWILSSMVIFTDKTHHTVWFKNTEILSDWTIAISNNSWTNN